MGLGYLYDVWQRTREPHKPKFTHLVKYINQFTGHRLQKFQRIHHCGIFPYKSWSSEIWPCHKIGQGQPRVIIWTNYDGLESQMLHTKFCGNRSTGPERKIFEGFLPYIVVVAILVMWPASCSWIFISLYLKAYIQNLVKSGPVISYKYKS